MADRDVRRKKIVQTKIQYDLNQITAQHNTEKGAHRHTQNHSTAKNKSRLEEESKERNMACRSSHSPPEMGGGGVDSQPLTQTVEGDFSAVSTEGAGATLPISVSTLLAACTLSPPRSVLNLASSGSSAAACRRARVRVRVRVGLRLRRNPNPHPNPHPNPNPNPNPTPNPHPNQGAPRA